MKHMRSTRIPVIIICYLCLFMQLSKEYPQIDEIVIILLILSLCFGVVGIILSFSPQKDEGAKIYTIEVIVEEQEFAESKSESASAHTHVSQEGASSDDGFMNIPDNIDEELPFH